MPMDPELLLANQIMAKLSRVDQAAQHRILAYVVDRYLRTSLAQSDGIAASPLTALLARSVAISQGAKP